MLDRFKVPEEIAVRVNHDHMYATVVSLFTTLGMSAKDAIHTADVLLYADIRGIDSHGVSNMTRAYVYFLQRGMHNATPAPRIDRDRGPMVTVDCDNGLGVAVCPDIMDLTIARARDHGVGVAVAFNAGHYGPAAYYADKALPHDMVGISMTTGGVQVAPTFGAEALLGLNPIGIAAPTNEEIPFLFDASMSSVAANKIHLLRRLGNMVCPGWIAGSDGEPIMAESPVPEQFLMLPLGGTREIGSHKGFGLMMLVEILTSLLGGTGGGPERRANSAHYFMALDVAAFTDLGQFKADMDSYLKRLRQCAPAPGEERVVYPGMLEHEEEIARREHGIPYHPEVIEWFTATCDELGAEHALASYR